MNLVIINGRWLLNGKRYERLANPQKKIYDILFEIKKADYILMQKSKQN